MLKNIHPGFKECIVIVTLDEKKRSRVEILNCEVTDFQHQSNKFSKIVYLEKFTERSKALRKLRYLKKLIEPDRLKYIKKKNPELLNLVFTIYDREDVTAK